MSYLKQIFEEVDSRIQRENEVRQNLGAPPLSFAEIKLFGQFALLVRDEIAGKLNLRATADLDATATGDRSVEQLLIETVKSHGLQYDHLSSEIWIPDGASFDVVYETNRFKVVALDTISVLVSKAVKAPDKNRILIRDALAVFGDELKNRLQKYSVDLKRFERPPGSENGIEH